MTLQGMAEGLGLNGLEVERAANHGIHLIQEQRNRVLKCVIPVQLIRDPQGPQRVIRCGLENLRDPTDEVFADYVRFITATIHVTSVPGIEKEAKQYNEYNVAGKLRNLVISLALSMGPDKFQSVIPQLESAALYHILPGSARFVKWIPLSRLLHGMGGYQSIWALTDGARVDRIQALESDTESMLKDIQDLLSSMELKEIQQKATFVESLGSIASSSVGGGNAGNKMLDRIVQRIQSGIPGDIRQPRSKAVREIFSVIYAMNNFP